MINNLTDQNSRWFHKNWQFTSLFIALLFISISSTAQAQNLARTFSDFSGSGKADHSAYTKLLKTYVKPSASGLNRVDYAKLKSSGKAKLTQYLDYLQGLNVKSLSKAEQFAYWVNLYNAKTLDVIISNYPVKSIRDIGGGLFSSGPWKTKVVKVNGIDLSLDNIEHDILRKVWRDPRVHYAVNCASIGCPNLQTKAFTGANKESLLEAGAKSYINSPRGVTVSGNRIIISKIYRWFAEDFGSREQLLSHLKKYAKPDLKTEIERIGRISSYEYDWNLNDAR